MGEAIGSSLPLAVGIAISPVPIIAVVLMLTTERARMNGPAFVLGWLLGLGVVGAVVLVVAASVGTGPSASPATWVSWVKIALGVLVLLLAARQLTTRPRRGEEPSEPKWMSTVDKMGPVGALGLGAVLAGANPKNLLLVIAGATTIAGTRIGGVEQAVAYAVFALIGTAGVGVPVVLYLVMGERSKKLLVELKDWMSEHNAVIMSVLCLIIAAKLIGDAIGALTG